VNDNASLVAVILGFMAFIGFLCWLFNSAWPVILVFLWLILDPSHANNRTSAICWI